MRRVIFERNAFEDFVEWANIDKKLYQRIVNLILDMLRHPFTGIGKPEPLRHELRGTGQGKSMMSVDSCIRSSMTPSLSFPASVTTHNQGISYYPCEG
jgi:hypothetical protein